MTVDDTITVDPSDEESNDNDVFTLGQEIATVDPLPQESSEEEDEEANSEDQSIPLRGSRLSVVSVGENEELSRVREQATPRKLFDSSSQPSPSDPRRESRSSLSSPSLSPNLS
jgi:hypothetical protein